MRSSKLLLGLAVALTLPSAAFAQDYSPFRRPAVFDPLPIEGTTEEVTFVDHMYPYDGPQTIYSRLWPVTLPFTFTYFGQSYDEINVGIEGYITFGHENGGDWGTGPADTKIEENQEIPTTAFPTGFIAAWWDSITCPKGDTKIQKFTKGEEEWVVVEWAGGCFVNATADAWGRSDVTVQTQIWLSPPNIIQVYYGELRNGSFPVTCTVGGVSGPCHSATVGLESPATYVGDTRTSPGGTEGFYGLLDGNNNPECRADCSASNWPRNTMIQYGRPLVDLVAGELWVTGLSSDGENVRAVVENTIENAGTKPAKNVTWDLYLSVDDVLDETDKYLPGCRHLVGETVPGIGSLTASTTCEFEHPGTGNWRLCVLVDPDDLVAESKERNNSWCTRPFGAGVDLTGEISIGQKAGLGSSVPITVAVSNSGIDEAGEFDFTIKWKDCAGKSPDREVHTGTLNLSGGQVYRNTFSVYLDATIKDQALCAELEIDTAGAVEEIVETNNIASTCGSSSGCMELTRPDLVVTDVRADMPNGCYFDERINVQATICNEGETRASAFATLFAIGDNTTASMWDPGVVAIPQSCAVLDPLTGVYEYRQSLCQGLGDQAECIRGICHVLCSDDTECGDQGLQCLDDPLFQAGGVTQKSCQLSLAQRECRSITASAILPTIDTSKATPEHPGGVDFVDGNYTIGAVVDWTLLLPESSEDNNKGRTSVEYACWIQRPDFDAVELRSLSPVGAGERFPVHRKVRNNGNVGGEFSYRYVLTSNQTPTRHDIPLDVVRIEDGKSIESPIETEDIDPYEVVEGVDIVRVPAGVAPGNYFLGIIIDPENEHDERFKANNVALWCDPQLDGTCAPHPIQVVDPALRIVTQSLPIATVGQSYDVKLLATGGFGSHEWSVSGGELPPDLTFDQTGRIQGTVKEQGDTVFRVTVRSGDASASATYAIRAIAASGPLVITTPQLPAAYVLTDYVAGLGASGGAPPYTWSCDGLPIWARLDGNTVYGKPTAVANAVPVSCTVIDVNQQALTADYTLQVKAVSGLRITSTSIGPFDVGVFGSATIGAAGGSGSYRWSFDDTIVPLGLEATESNNRGVIEGTPSVCGSFVVGVTVADIVTEVTDTGDLPLVVSCDAPRLATRDLPVAVRGKEYPDTQLSAERAVSFAVVRGELPRGVTLSMTGLLAGRVASDANVGDHSVAIELHDAAGGTGLGALTISVQASGPEVDSVQKIEEGGCSASGGGSTTSLFPLALVAVVLFRNRSRKSTGVALVAALATLAPATASAQDYPRYGWTIRDNTYQPLSGGTSALSSNCTFPASSCMSRPISLPFTFRYFGQEYDRIWIESKGRLHFSTQWVGASNEGIPEPGGANSFIAPWWTVGMRILSAANATYLVRGTAPNREFVVEWLFSPTLNSTVGQMQVSLYENGTFAMRWGASVAINNRAAVGFEDATGSPRSQALLPCSERIDPATLKRMADCVQTDWNNNLRNKEAFFDNKPNLVIVEARTASEGRAGYEQEFRVTARNVGLTSASAAIELFISPDQTISESDSSIGKTPILEFGPGETVTASITVPLPLALDPGMYHLLARVDPGNTVEELSEADNDGGAFEFAVLDRSTDLVISRIEPPLSGSPGSRIAVEFDVASLGNLEADGVSYSILLSTNKAISESDLLIHQGSVDIAPLTTVTVTALAELPSDIPAGRYYLGAMIDLENAVRELDEFNNVRASERTILVGTDGLRVVTELPALLQVGAPYCFPLEAEGGNGVYTWSLGEGTLPPGLVLAPGGEADPIGGSLCGVPTAVGAYRFTLDVSSGGKTSRAEASLEVIAVRPQLGIATRVLPIANFGVLYEAGLSAKGGIPPYRWAVLSGELPAGLAFGEDGLVYGIPLVDGQFSLEVEVSDAVDNTAKASVDLGIASPGRVTCSTRTLGSVEVGSEIGGRLLAGGGTGSYVWTSKRTQRLGDAGGLPLADDEAPPPGIELSSNGAFEGAPAQIGQYLWTVEVTSGGNADTCTISVEVFPGPGPGLTVITTAIPSALVDEDYSVQLEAAGGDGNYRWTLVEGRGLPDGLGLGETGVLSGGLAVDLLQGKESRTWSFLVQVRDGQNRRGIGPLAVTLTTRKDLATFRQRTETTESGCSTSGGGFGLVAIGLVLLGLRRRR